MKTAVLITGRFSGFHAGHAKLIKQAYNKYVDTRQLDKLVIAIVVSASSKKIYDEITLINENLEKLKNVSSIKDPRYKQKKKLEKLLVQLNKNPFDFNQRKYAIDNYIKHSSMNIDNIHIIAVEHGHIPTIKEELVKDDIDVKVLFCGEDREDTYKTQTDKLENLDYVVDFIEREMDDKRSGSGTQIRQSLLDNDFEEFKALMPNEFDDFTIEEVWNTYRSALKTRGLISGITHFEDLDVDDFVYWLKNLYNDNIEIIQKLDGTFNMSIVRDKQSIYFARLAKRQENAFTADSLPKNPMYNALRGACKALEDNRVQKVLVELLLPEEALDIEVLYGVQPNTIKYNLDANYLAVLRFIRTNKDRLEQVEAIKEIVAALKEITVSVSNKVYNFDWSEEANVSKIEEETWKFTTPQLYNKHKLVSKNISFEDDIKSIYKWLETPTKEIPTLLNKDALAINLIEIPKNERSIYKEAREKAREDIKNLKKSVKTKLMNHILEDLEFDLGGKTQEGLVVKDLSDNEGRITKLVNRDGFTKENQRNWYYMEQVNDIIMKDFFAFLSSKLNLPILNVRNKLFKDLSNATDKEDFILNEVFSKYANIDIENFGAKLQLVKNEIGKAQKKLINLVEESKNDDILSETFKKRTANSLGASYQQFNNVKNNIDSLIQIDSDVAAAIQFILLLYTSFSSRAKDS